MRRLKKMEAHLRVHKRRRKATSIQEKICSQENGSCVICCFIYKSKTRVKKPLLHLGCLWCFSVCNTFTYINSPLTTTLDIVISLLFSEKKIDLERSNPLPKSRSADLKCLATFQFYDGSRALICPRVSLSEIILLLSCGLRE